MSYLMNLQFFIEKLQDSDEFKEFIEKHSDAFLASCFFVIDVAKPNNEEEKKYHLDYFIPSEKRMVAFELEKGIKQSDVELYGREEVPSKLKAISELEFDEIKSMIWERMQKESVNKELQKIIMSLQNVNGRDVFVCTVFISGLGIVRCWIDDENKEITEFEKKSFFDFMRKV